MQLMKKIDDLTIDMQQLNKHAEDIEQILSVISDIADQTNLLAFKCSHRSSKGLCSSSR